ncbi:MAG: hypothetical protein ACRC2R_16120 [Xenococcaceae cyanobacterium]
MSELTKEVSKAEIRQRLGNIVQIRDLILGDKIEEYELRFAQMDKSLSDLTTKLNAFQLETENRFLQVQKTFKEEIDLASNSLEKKLQYLSVTSQENTNKIQQELLLTSKKSSQQLGFLQDSVTRQITFVNDEISQTREMFLADVQNFKKSILERLEEKTAELQDGKIGKSDLAEILFEICLKVNGSDFAPEPKDVTNIHLNGNTVSNEKEEQQN